MAGSEGIAMPGIPFMFCAAAKKGANTMAPTTTASVATEWYTHFSLNIEYPDKGPGCEQSNVSHHPRMPDWHTRPDALRIVKGTYAFGGGGSGAVTAEAASDVVGSAMRPCRSAGVAASAARALANVIVQGAITMQQSVLAGSSQGASLDAGDVLCAISDAIPALPRCAEWAAPC